MHGFVQLALVLLLLAPSMLIAAQEQQHTIASVPITDEDYSLIIDGAASALRRKTSYPTKKPSTRKPSKAPTAKPSKKQATPKPSQLAARDEEKEALITRVPTVVYTTMFPTTNPATKRPTTGMGESRCTRHADVESCQTQSEDCEWYSMQTCNYFVSPVTCQKFEYGCQEKRQFCDFSQGEELDRLMQCNSKGFPCKWEYTTLSCDLATRAPSPPPFTRTLCSNTCVKAKNGQCNDGGAGSVDAICELGTDCDDCSWRLV